MKTGSSTIWVTTGIIHSSVENPIRPSARTRLEKPVAVMLPASRMSAYAFASCATSGVAPSSRTSGSRKMIPSTPRRARAEPVRCEAGAGRARGAGQVTGAERPRQDRGAAGPDGRRHGTDEHEQRRRHVHGRERVRTDPAGDEEGVRQRVHPVRGHGQRGLYGVAPSRLPMGAVPSAAAASARLMPAARDPDRPHGSTSRARRSDRPGGMMAA
jgi:hypothetical protein